jgi:hypothetical protein
MDSAYAFTPTPGEEKFTVQELPRMNDKRYHHGICHNDGFVFVLGGMDQYGVKSS